MFSKNGAALTNPLILYSTNAMVSEVNAEALRNLTTKRFLYLGKKGEYKGMYKIPPAIPLQEYFKDLPCLLETNLCEGARVVLVTNAYRRDYKVHNGSRGRVVSCQKDTVVVNFGEVNGVELELMIEYQSWWVNGQECKQLPLKLAYAMTVHKCQGLTITKSKEYGGVLLNMSDIFAPSIFLVGASRVEERSQLWIEDFDIEKMKLDPIVVKFNRRLLKGQITQLQDPLNFNLMDKCEELGTMIGLQ